jgi:hypothetical protein
VTAEFQREAFMDMLEKQQIPKEKVVAIVSDTPNVMKVNPAGGFSGGSRWLTASAPPPFLFLFLQAWWALMIAVMPWLLAIPCLCHVLNLFCKVCNRGTQTTTWRLSFAGLFFTIGLLPASAGRVQAAQNIQAAVQGQLPDQRFHA